MRVELFIEGSVVVAWVWSALVSFAVINESYISGEYYYQNGHIYGVCVDGPQGYAKRVHTELTKLGIL